MPRKTTTTKDTTAATAKPAVRKETVPVVEKQETQETKQPYRVKNILTPNTFVTVRNGFNGKLIYKSHRTNEKFVWDGFGAEQDIELQELKSAKSTHKSFFANNWFLFDDPEVIAYLGVERFYDSALSFNEFDEIFNQTPDKIAARIATIPDGQKRSLVYKAKQLIADGTIDSMKTVNVLEKALNVELIER